MTIQTREFEADTGKILNIVINSLYSNKEIFLRELLSNASDAINKRQYLGQVDGTLLNSGDRAGQMPPAEEDGEVYLKVPINRL